MLRDTYNVYKYHFFSMISSLKKVSGKFVIVSLGRTGSTLLTSLLNCHSEIYCDSEIFMRPEHKRMYFPYMFINGHFRKLKKKQVYGFKLKEEQLSIENKINSNVFLSKLNENGWKFIRLSRRNRLKLALSVYISWEDGIYEIKNRNNYEKKKDVFVDLKKFKEILDFHDNLLKKEEKALLGINYLELIYENDLINVKYHQNTANTVFSFLGLENENVETVFIKKSEDDLSVLIANYKEFELFFKNTKYEHFL